MGVPGFFAWLIKHAKTKKMDTIYSADICDTDIDTLYIDANCLFHPQCHKILAHYTDIKDVKRLEEKMIA